MRYSCVGEGEDFKLDLTWSLTANGHLLQHSEGETNEYVRCDQKKTGQAAGATKDSFAGKYAGKLETFEWSASIDPAEDQRYKVTVSVNLN